VLLPDKSTPERSHLRATSSSGHFHPAKRHLDCCHRAAVRSAAGDCRPAFPTRQTAGSSTWRHLPGATSIYRRRQSRLCKERPGLLLRFRSIKICTNIFQNCLVPIVQRNRSLPNFSINLEQGNLDLACHSSDSWNAPASMMAWPVKKTESLGATFHDYRFIRCDTASIPRWPMPMFRSRSVKS